MDQSVSQSVSQSVAGLCIRLTCEEIAIDVLIILYFFRLCKNVVITSQNAKKPICHQQTCGADEGSEYEAAFSKIIHFVIFAVSDYSIKTEILKL